MKTVILCGGFGTRIRGVADDIPKPMIPIGRFPILWHIMKTYSEFGIKEFILCLGYKSEVVKDFFLNYRAMVSDCTISLDGSQAPVFHNTVSEADWKVTLAETGLNAMTGSRVRQIQKYVGEETFMLTYGDGVGNIDIAALIAFHKSHGRIATVTGVQPPGRFGELVLDGSKVLSFNEKPQITGGYINGGFFVLDSRIFDYLDDREDLVLEKEPLRRLVADQQLMVFKHDGFWQPMDTYREYSMLNEMFMNGSAPWVRW